MTNKPYFAYLLRLWKSGDPETPGWLASLEDPHSRQTTGFSSVKALNDYLIQLVQQMESTHDTPKKENEHETKK